MILMDTCAIIWDALDRPMTPKALTAINNADAHNALIICDISLWEISMLIKKGRIEMATTPANFIHLFLQSRNIEVVPISPEIADLSVNLGAEINNDPADRIIAATSIIKNAQLITADANLLSCGMIDTLW